MVNSKNCKCYATDLADTIQDVKRRARWLLGFNKTIISVVVVLTVPGSFHVQEGHTSMNVERKMAPGVEAYERSGEGGGGPALGVGFGLVIWVMHVGGTSKA